MVGESSIDSGSLRFCAVSKFKRPLSQIPRWQCCYDEDLSRTQTEALIEAAKIGTLLLDEKGRNANSEWRVPESPSAVYCCAVQAVATAGSCR